MGDTSTLQWHHDFNCEVESLRQNDIYRYEIMGDLSKCIHSLRRNRVGMKENSSKILSGVSYESLA